MSQSKPRKSPRVQVGVVTSAKCDKTRTVAVEYLQQHRKYGKYQRRQVKYQVHDEQNQAKAGDRVEISPCRRMSKSKSWRLVRVVEAAPTDA